MMPQLVTFNCTDTDIFTEFQRLKFAVFYEENGWTGLLVDPDQQIVLQDCFDEGSSFLGLTWEGKLVGGLRYSRLDSAFPHAELFPPSYGDALTVTATITGVALLPDYRRRRLESTTSTWGDWMLRTCVERCAELEVEEIIATAGLNGAERIFVRHGFERFGKPYQPAWSPMHLTNLHRMMKPALSKNG
ncbi:MAG: hypothetical protein E1N59_1574 [Puniceicoccaceae bacterium 5H]|nr:MAG: hypothetical protein E1N59_1574 [Puniceicoccaceae bacterium 5H]